jgi:hypothetical protein
MNGGPQTSPVTQRVNWLEIVKTISALFTPIVVAYSLIITNKIHTATNSAMTEQKRVAWVSAETLASVTHDPGHIALAKEAKAVYEASRTK